MGARLQVEPLAGARVTLVDVVAQRVAAVPPTVQADASVEADLVAAPVGRALLVLVDQGVDEEMDGSLVGTFDRLLKPCDEMGELENLRFWCPEQSPGDDQTSGHLDECHHPQSLTVPTLAPPKSVPSCLILLLSGGSAGSSAQTDGRCGGKHVLLINSRG